MGALWKLARRYPLAAAAIYTELLAIAVGLARLQQHDEDAEAQGIAEALAYLREHGKPIPGWSILFTLAELEEITGSGTLNGRSGALQRQQGVVATDTKSRRRVVLLAAPMLAAVLTRNPELVEGTAGTH
jgi:hypothetical protein